MTTKDRISITLIIFAMSSILSACGQSNSYPPLTKQDFDTDNIYS